MAEPKVAVVTDSTCDLDPETAKALGVDVVSLYVIFGERRYRDLIDISRREFFSRMASEAALPITSQPTSADFEAAFRKHVEAGRPIVGIFIAQYLSGTINAAQAAAAQFPGADITLLDSYSISGGLGLHARGAAEMALQGATRAEVVERVKRDRDAQTGLATFPDLSHAVRTGRVTRAQAAIGNVFKIVPVLRIGHVKLEEMAKVRTFPRALETLVEATAVTLGDVANARITVAHANAPETGSRLIEMLRAKLPAQPQLLDCVEAGPAISVHTGAGAAAIFSIPG